MKKSPSVELPRIQIPPEIVKLQQLINKRERLFRKTLRKLRDIQGNCVHQFPPMGSVNFLDSETCVKCGKDCHDPEEWK